MFFKTLINTWRSWTICLCTIFQDLDFWRDFLTISDEQQLLIYYLESLVPIVLGTFQSARNFGHWKVYHFRSRIFTGMWKHASNVINILRVRECCFTHVHTKRDWQQIRYYETPGQRRHTNFIFQTTSLTFELLLKIRNDPRNIVNWSDHMPTLIMLALRSSKSSLPLLHLFNQKLRQGLAAICDTYQRTLNLSNAVIFVNEKCQKTKE